MIENALAGVKAATVCHFDFFSFKLDGIHKNTANLEIFCSNLTLYSALSLSHTCSQQRNAKAFDGKFEHYQM
jgi:hypothetical protein